MHRLLVSLSVVTLLPVQSHIACDHDTILLLMLLAPGPQVEEERPIRLEPVGLDRRHNRYWRFGLGAAMGDAAALATWGPDLLQADPCLGRLYVESGASDRCVRV